MPPKATRRRTEGLAVEPVTSGQRVNPSAPGGGAAANPRGAAPEGVRVGAHGDSGTAGPSEDAEAPRPHTHTLSYVSLPSGCS